MSYQTGTVAHLNDLLDVFATFLAAAGWTIVGNWLEPMFTFAGTSGIPAQPTSYWRYARRVHASKGAMFVSMQDFYIGPQWYQYASNGGAGIGPSIALHMGTGFSGGSPGVTADHELHHDYDGTGPSTFGTFSGPGGPITMSGRGCTAIMPLPSVVGQVTGKWLSGAMGMSLSGPIEDPQDETLPALFGVPEGAIIPCKYWMFADATGDNVLLATLRNREDLAVVPVVTYLYFGTLQKEGTWTGGQYFGATHGNNWVYTGVWTGTYQGQQVVRFGPPGAMADELSVHTFLRADIPGVISSGWLGLCTTTNPTGWTGGKLSSTTLMAPKSFFESPRGLEQNGVHYGTMRYRRSISGNAAPLLPTYWTTQLPNGLYTILGLLPNIFQANTLGFGPGTETLGPDGNTYVIFDDFAVRKVL